MSEEVIRFKLVGEDAVSGVAREAFRAVEREAVDSSRRVSSQTATPRSAVEREAAVAREMARIRAREEERATRERQERERRQLQVEAKRRLDFENYTPIRFKDEPERIIPFAPPKREVNRTPLEQRTRDLMAAHIRSMFLETERAAQRALDEQAQKEAQRRLFGDRFKRVVERTPEQQYARDFRASEISRMRAEAREAQTAEMQARVQADVRRQMFGDQAPLRRVQRSSTEQEARDRAAELIREERASRRSAAAETAAAALYRARMGVNPGQQTVGQRVGSFFRGKSDLGDLGQLARVAGVGAVAAGAEGLTSGMKDVAEESLRGGLTLSDKFEMGGKSVPILGSVFGAARNIRDIWDAKANDRDARREETRQEGYRRAARNRSAIIQDQSRSREAALSMQGSERSLWSTSQRLAADALPLENRDLADLQIARNEAIDAAAAERDRKIAESRKLPGDYSKLLPDAKAANDRTRAAEAAAAQQEYRAKELAAQQQYTRASGDLERQRTRDLDSTWRAYSVDRIKSYTSHRTALMRLQGMFDEAELEEVESSANEERMARTHAYKQEVKDLDKNGERFKAAKARFEADLIDIGQRQRDRAAAVEQQQGRDERNRGEARREATESRRGDTRERVLRLQGREQTADRAAVLRELDEERARIRRQQRADDEKNGGAEDREKHRREAEDALNAARASALTRLAEINSRDVGADLDRGSQAASGLLGARLTGVETFIRQQQPLDPNVLKEIEKYNGQTAAKLDSIATDMKTMAEWIRTLK
jgi:hypothetical protein